MWPNLQFPAMAYFCAMDITEESKSATSSWRIYSILVLCYEHTKTINSWNKCLFIAFMEKLHKTKEWENF